MSATEHKQCDDVKGLDDAPSTENYIYIQSGDETHQLTVKQAAISALLKTGIIDNTNDNDDYGRMENNPYVVDERTDPSGRLVKFAVDYMRMSNGTEATSPEKPLKDIDMSVVLGEEFPLFSQIYDKNGSPLEQINAINEYILVALYFQFNYLHEKLSAVCASMLKGLSINELKAIFGEKPDSDESKEMLD